MGGNNAKTTILDGSKGYDQATAIAHLLGGGSSSGYTGSTSYGYAIPGISSSPSVINLSQIKGSDSNIVNSLTSALGGNGGQTKVLILGGQNTGGGAMATSPSVIQLSSVPGFNAMSSGSIMGYGGGNTMGFGGGNTMGFGGGLNLGENNGYNGLTNGLNGMNTYGRGLNFGRGFGEMSLGSNPNVYHMYSNKPRRLPFKFGGHSTRSENVHSTQHSNTSKQCDYCQQSSKYGQKVMRDTPKRPIPVGEKFSYRP